jgi:hypothetical protein
MVTEQREKWYAHIGRMEDNGITELTAKYKLYGRRGLEVQGEDENICWRCSLVEYAKKYMEEEDVTIIKL